MYIIMYESELCVIHITQLIHLIAKRLPPLASSATVKYLVVPGNNCPAKKM